MFDLASTIAPASLMRFTWKASLSDTKPLSDSEAAPAAPCRTARAKERRAPARRVLRAWRDIMADNDRHHPRLRPLDLLGLLLVPPAAARGHGRDHGRPRLAGRAADRRRQVALL